MDLGGKSKPVWIRPDLDDDRETSSSSSKRPKNSHRSRPQASVDGVTNKQLFMRQASHMELSMSSPHGASPLKQLQTRTTPITFDSSTKATPHLSKDTPHLAKATPVTFDRLAKNTPMTFDRLAKATPVKLHKFHTEPLLRALCEELKKETGVAPEIPEKSHNPFEPENLADFFSKNLTNPRMFADRPPSPEGFRWSIDHLSQLHPVEIDNRVDLMRTELLKHVHTDSDEETAQIKIRNFFEEIYDLPSPASNEEVPSLFPDLDSSSEASDTQTKRLVRNLKPVEVACQTDVHMSPNFDFDRFFADFKIRMERNCVEKNVRRRLFAEEEDFEMQIENRLDDFPNRTENFENETENVFPNRFDESTGFGSQEQFRQNRSSGFFSKFEIDAELSPVEDDTDEDHL